MFKYFTAVLPVLIKLQKFHIKENCNLQFFFTHFVFYNLACRKVFPYQTAATAICPAVAVFRIYEESLRLISSLVYKHRLSSLC